MIESMTDIPMPSGTMDAFIAHPQEGGPFPAVFVLMDFWGHPGGVLRHRPPGRDGRLLLYRPQFLLPPGPGAVRASRRARTHEVLRHDSGSEQQRMQDQLRKLSDQMAMDDIGALLGFLRTQPVTPGPKAAIGYCLGGRYVFQAGPHLSRRFPRHRQHARHAAHDRRAAVAAQAGDRCRGEIYCAFGEHDDLTGPG